MVSSQKYTFLKDTIFNITIGVCGICTGPFILI